MLKRCEHCGQPFEGSPQARFHSDACRKAHARELGQRDGRAELGQANSDGQRKLVYPAAGPRARVVDGGTLSREQARRIPGWWLGP